MVGGVYAALAFFRSGAAWVYIVAFVGFEFWMLRALRSAGSGPAAVGQAPYHFNDDEAEIIGRYRLYFTYPARARQCSSILSAIGLSTLLLAPWLIYKQAFLQALVIGVNLFAVARLTKAVAPGMTLRVAASHADRNALRLLEAHDSAWSKIRAGNASPDTNEREDS